jgi:hypothetical protein
LNNETFEQIRPEGFRQQLQMSPEGRALPCGVDPRECLLVSWDCLQDDDTGVLISRCRTSDVPINRHHRDRREFSAETFV